MFNLEQALADWQQQMLAAGIKSPGPLEELEIHLREDIAQQMQSGLNEQEAFTSAVQKIGQARALKLEFKKIGTTTMNMMRTIALLAALFGTVLGGAMVLPALGQWRDRGILHLGPLLVGAAVGIIAACAVVYGVKTHRAARDRKLIGAFIVLAGSFYVVPLIQAFFISKIDWAGWLFCAVLATASVLFYGNCLYRLWHSPGPPIAESQQGN